MIGLDNYTNDGFAGGAEVGQAELQKAMQAGQITGRDTTGQLLTQEPLKVESLEKTLKLLEFRTQDIKLWNAVPKQTAYNTVEEFIQLVSYGNNRGGFYDEGELSNVEDSKYKRQAEHVKYIQVTGEVTIQAQMVRSYVDAMRKEVENKMMWISRTVNQALTKADSQFVPQEFNSFYAQHAKIGTNVEDLYATFEDYYNSGVVIDLRGRSLKQDDIENGAVAVDANFGWANTLFAPTTVISAFSQDYYERQRIIAGATGYQGSIGTPIKGVDTTIGNIALMSDKFMKQDGARKAIDPATSQQAPSAPVWDGTTPAAVASNNISKYISSEAGNAYFAVAAINRYGESPLAVSAAAVAITAGNHIDLKFTAGVSSVVAPTGFVIYRTKITTAGSATGLEFFPIFKISTANLANGYNGAGAGVVRDLGYFLPDTEQAFITQMDEEVLAFKQLAPISKLDLAVQSMSRRFITFLFGTPVLGAPKKMVRYINAGKRLTA